MARRPASFPRAHGQVQLDCEVSIFHHLSPPRAASHSPCSLRMGDPWAACLRATFFHLLWPLGGTAPQCHAPVPPPANLVRASAHSSVSTPLPVTQPTGSTSSLVLTTASSTHSCPFRPCSLPLVVHFTPSLPTDSGGASGRGWGSVCFTFVLPACASHSSQL